MFRFYKDFKWVYVIVDDRLPCLEVQKDVFSPIFAGTESGHEFWVALIEKAYAKLHHSYQSIESGHLNLALKDLTGLFLKNLALKFSKPDDFYASISDFIKRKALISCSKWGNAENQKDNSEEIQGLKENFAYRLLNTFEINDDKCKNSHKSHRLFLLQNPMVHEKIGGTWAHESVKFKAFATKIKEMNIDINGNNFLLRFKNFRTFYDEIHAMYQPPKEAKVYYGLDEWTKSNSGGPPIQNDQKALKNWLKNPKYFFQIAKSDEKTRVFVELSQPDPRMLKKAFFPFSDELNFLFFMVMKHENMKNKKIEK